MTHETSHIPVLLNEVIEVLKANLGGEFLDCTLGGGGHTLAILEANESNKVVAIDRDKRAIERSNKRLSNFGPRLKVIHGNFARINSVLSDEKFDGIVADLGISTDQLKENRGFSFNDSAELDMRMDESDGRTAYWVVNETRERELFETLKRGGVGREARAIAAAIVRSRPIKTTRELSALINQTVPGNKEKKVNPSTVAFQAIRMAVNEELESIERFLDGVTDFVKPGGRLAVITFHSLEDKVVANRMRSWEGGEFSAMWPGSKPQKPRGRVVERKAIKPSEAEIAANPSSRSARLRAFEFYG
jgi:16S rRNA (cytosine1402-N4)-methyltransferase